MRARSFQPARQRSKTARQRGSVTIETAIAVSALGLVMAMCLAGIAAMIVSVRVTDAASEAARLAARGDVDAAHVAVGSLAPPGASLALSGSDLVTATVTAPTLGTWLPGLRVSAVAVFAREPGVP